MSLRRHRGLWILGLAVSLSSGACGGDSPAGPTPPAGPQLSLVCPPAQSGVSFQGQPATISWPAPTPQGGTPPIQTSCTPASGSAFSPGVTAVSCTATGAGNQAAGCAFTVTVTRPPQISVTRFIAFGDSITEGQQSPAPAFLVVVPMEDYPFRLNVLLSARYADQSIVVNNEGVGGEAIATGLARLPSVLTARNPQVLLLLDGANDLLNAPSSTTVDYIVRKLGDMVRLAKGHGVKVMLATFPPQRQGGIPGYHGSGAPFVLELNQKIAALADSEGTFLADVYAGFPTDTTRLIGIDGLHPTADGYTLMAQTFARIIQEKFEVKATAGR